MISADEDALICDLAETYHIYDHRALPVSYVAALACGLDENSRIKRIISGQKLPVQTMLLAAIADRLGLLCWAQTSDACKGQNRPKSILDAMLAGAEKNTGESDIETYSSAEEFIAQRNILAGKGEG